MGQQFFDECFDDCSSQELQDKIRARLPNLYFPASRPVAQCSDTVFENENDALNWLHNNPFGRRGLYAGRFKRYAALTQEERGPAYLAQEKAVTALRLQIAGFGEAVVRKAAAEASKPTATCDGCGSKINVQAYLKSTRQGNTGCPVCPGNLLVKPAQAKALDRLKAQAEKEQAALDKLGLQRRKLAKKDLPTIFWLVGYWASEPQCHC